MFLKNRDKFIMNQNKYILITSARNEEKYIENTICSVINQTLLPLCWIIISDCSEDRTDEIIKNYTFKYPFIKFLRNDIYVPDMLVSQRKVANINSAFETVGHLTYDYLGILDGDVTFSENYYATLVKKFIDDPLLGLTGGFIYNDINGKLNSMFTNPDNVGGPIQFFRKECYFQIGGYLPIVNEDSIAIIKARMHNWKVKSFPNIIVKHHKPAGLPGRNIIKAKIHVGRMEHIIGDHWLYQFIRCIRYFNEKPFILNSILKLFGYWRSVILREKVQPPSHIVEFLQDWQLKKIGLGFLAKNYYRDSKSTNIKK